MKVALGIALGGFVLFCGALFMLVSAGHSPWSTENAPPAATVAAEPAPEPLHIPAQPAPTLGELVQRAPNLFEALKLTIPLMRDITLNDGVSQGAVLLASWMSGHPFWDDIMKMADVKRADVMKDSDSFRGDRLCVTGSVMQIVRDKSAPFRLFNGTMQIGLTDFVTFMAVGGTTDVVEHVTARLCGITTGTETYKTQFGGEMTAVQIVGGFDRVYLGE